MTDDLIERLRALSRHEHSDYSIGDEAATALEMLENRYQAELANAERLAEVLRKYRYAPKFSHYYYAIKQTVELEDEIDDLLREQEDGRD